MHLNKALASPRFRNRSQMKKTFSHAGKLLVLWALALLGMSYEPLCAGAATLSTTFTNPNPESSGFGWSVSAIAPDKVVVGAPSFSSAAGRAYVFGTNGALLTNLTNPLPSNGDLFGWAVAAVGTDRALVGAWRNSTMTNNAGIAYLFSTDGVHLATITNPLPRLNEGFGWSVASVGSDKLVIGTYHGEAAYLFSTNSELLTTFPTNGGCFGFAVAGLGSDKAIIGAPYFGAGRAYLFSTNGTLITTFTNPYPAQYPESFGDAVAAFEPDKVLIGNSSDGTFTEYGGEAYLFHTNGVLLTTFTNPAPAYKRHFASSLVAIGSDRVLIGSGGNGAYLFSTNGALLTTFPVGYAAVAALGSNNALIGDYGNVFLFTLPGPSLSIVSSAPGQMRISWLPNTPGFVLQRSSSVSTNWANAPTGETNPVIIPATWPTEFFRLFKP